MEKPIYPVFVVKSRGALKMRKHLFIEFLKSIGLRVLIINGIPLLAIEFNNQYRILSNEQLAAFVKSKIIECYPDGMPDATHDDILDCVMDNYTSVFKSGLFSFLPTSGYVTNFDTKEVCMFSFQNGHIRITLRTIERLDLGDFDRKLLDTDILPRDIQIKQADFLTGEVARLTWHFADHSIARFRTLVTVIGYLVHRFKDPANPKIIILLDQIANEDEGANGGVGKSLFVKILSHVRNIFNIAGKSYRNDYVFTYEGIEENTAIVNFEDANRNMHLDSLFNMSTDDLIIHRKHKTALRMKFEKSPKIVITTNHILKQVEGNSSERRKFEVEFSEYFNSERSPKDVFGHLLFDDWSDDSEEWHHYYNFIFYCVQYYLRFGLIKPPKININNRKLHSQVGQEIIDFMDEKLAEGKKKFHKQDLYNEFVQSGAIVNRNYLPNRNGFSRKVKLYFTYKNINFKEDPADTKKYFVIIDEDLIAELTGQNIDSADHNYKLVDTIPKVKRVIKKLKGS